MRKPRTKFRTFLPTESFANVCSFDEFRQHFNFKRFKKIFGVFICCMKNLREYLNIKYLRFLTLNKYLTT